MSFFESLTSVPDDPIFGLAAAFAADVRSKKVNLGIGAYRTADGKPLVLSSVQKAEALLLDQGLHKQYLPISGDAEFIDELLKVVFASSLDRERTYGLQSVGGTGALRIAADFIASEEGKIVYLSQPTWPNHKNIFGAAGFQIARYPYYDYRNNTIDFENIVEAISNMSPKDVIVLQASCHNPTGTDFSFEQWKTLSALIKERGIIPLFDMAYQGFGQGLDDDAQALRYFVDQGHEMFVAASCSKNFGLYGERLGLLAFVGDSKDIAQTVGGHLCQIVRASYSNPPCHPARIVKTILMTKELKNEWENELSNMRERVDEMRKALIAGLQARGHEKDFSFMKKQQGMFSYCGLDKDQAQRIRRDHGIYIPSNGRINIAGLTSQNLENVIEAILAAISE